MAPLWCWDDARKRPAPGSIRSGDIIGTIGYTSAAVSVRTIQFAIAATSSSPPVWKLDWAKTVAHVGIACDHQFVIDAMWRRNGSGGDDVARIALFPDMVDFGQSFAVLRWDSGRFGVPIVAAAAGFLGQSYSLTGATKRYVVAALRHALPSWIVAVSRNPSGLSSGLTCSTLVHQAFEQSLQGHSPFMGMRPPLYVPLPADIVACPGFELVQPSWV